MPTEAEIAWAAGLFEGEGCIIERTQRARDGSTLHYQCLQLTMTDRDVVERFHQVVGCGWRYSIRPKVQNGRGTKILYDLHIGRRHDVERILLMLRPWLGERRGAKADQALAALALRT